MIQALANGAGAGEERSLRNPRSQTSIQQQPLDLLLTQLLRLVLLVSLQVRL
jgi:hypothetical protein